LAPHRVWPGFKSHKITRLTLIEALLSGYIFFVLLALILNLDSLGSRRFIADATNTITFIVVYLCAKKFIKQDDFALFQTGILIFASISAFLGIYQFFVNPDFFRLGVARGAFSDYIRSNGLFTAEYDQGLFLVISMVIVMSMDLKGWLKAFLIVLFGVGVFLTMHRLSWVAMLITLGLLWFFYLRKNLLAYILVPLSIISIIILAITIPWSRLTIGKFGSSMIADRIFADTLTERFSQYLFSFYMMKEYPFGIGGYQTSFYNQVAFNQGLPLIGKGYDLYKDAVIVHNGFLSAGVKYGLIGLILFVLFLYTSIHVFLKYSIQKGGKWIPLFMIMLIFLIFNFTNDFSFLGTQVSVALAWLIGGHISINYPSGHDDNRPSMMPVQTNG
jgi:hypothetical protein